MRRALPYIISLLLGVCAAFLVACAGETKGGIPAASAGELKSQIDDVRERVQAGDCNELNAQLRQIDEGIDSLPASVDERLKQALRDGATRLRDRAPSECNSNDTSTKTETQTTPAETSTETTTATTTETTTTETVPTQTLPPVETVPTVPPPPPVEPPPVEPPPPVNPGGGIEPEIPPQ